VRIAANKIDPNKIVADRIAALPWRFRARIR
jgi:hypothetical protein